MAVEIRRFIFDVEELKAIVDLYMRSGSSNLSAGVVVSAELITESPLTFQVCVQSNDGTQSVHELGEDHLASSIISFCLKKKIPVPRNATRTIKKSEDGNFAFDLVIQSRIT